jgi:FkbM family methyltransferase
LAGPIALRRSLPDHSIFWQCVVQRQYDLSRFAQTERLMAAYEAALQRGVTPLIIDCGGNVGLSALHFAHAFPRARIFVIEPDHENCELLRLNTRGVSDRVTVLEGGIWNQIETLQISNPESGSAAFHVAPIAGTPSEGIRAYTVPEICAMAGAAGPFIVKIDIEGAQRALFSSETDWVGQTHLIMLELDDWLLPWQGTSRPFFSCVSKYPFDYLISGETIFCFRDWEA